MDNNDKKNGDYAQVVNSSIYTGSNVQMPVVGVKVNGQFDTFALVDTASSSSFCSNCLVNALGVQGSKVQYKLKTLNQSKNNDSQELTLTAHPVDGEKPYTCLMCMYTEDQIKQLWEVENEDASGMEVAMSQEDKTVLTIWDRDIRFVSGLYELPIPWKHTRPHMSKNMNMASSHHRNLEARLNKDQDMKETYSEIIKQAFRKWVC